MLITTDFGKSIDVTKEDIVTGTRIEYDAINGWRFRLYLDDKENAVITVPRISEKTFDYNTMKLAVFSKINIELPDKEKLYYYGIESGSLKEKYRLYNSQCFSKDYYRNMKRAAYSNYEKNDCIYVEVQGQRLGLSKICIMRFLNIYTVNDKWVAELVIPRMDGFITKSIPNKTGVHYKELKKIVFKELGFELPNQKNLYEREVNGKKIYNLYIIKRYNTDKEILEFYNMALQKNGNVT